MRKEIREFRGVLRNFEREIEIQNSNCCNSVVSLAQCHLLLDVEKNNSVTITELAEIQTLDKSTISRTVDALYNKGLISREENPESRRQSLVSLTKEGKKVCSSINRTNDSFFLEIFKKLPKKDFQNFNSIFNKITREMKCKREGLEETGTCCK